MSNKFYVFQEFDEDIAKDFVEWVHEHDKKRTKTLTVYINSPGGHISSLLSMLDAMRWSHHKFRTIATGQAQSCGFMLFIAGDERQVSESACVMSHQYRWGLQGKHHELAETAKQFEVTMDWMRSHYIAHSTKKLTKKDLNKLLGPSDYYPTPDEMLKMGLADEVI